MWARAAGTKGARRVSVLAIPEPSARRVGQERRLKRPLNVAQSKRREVRCSHDGAESGEGLVRIELIGEADREARHRRRRVRPEVDRTAVSGGRSAATAASAAGGGHAAAADGSAELDAIVSGRGRLVRATQHGADIPPHEPSDVAVVKADPPPFAVVLLHHLPGPPAVVQVSLDSEAGSRVEVGREERHVAQAGLGHLWMTRGRKTRTSAAD